MWLRWLLGVGIAAWGCSEPPAAHVDAPRVARLLDAGTPATLGAQTRIATGSSGIVLFTETYEPGDDLPRFVRLPPELAADQRVLLNYRYWGRDVDGRLPGVRVAQTSVAAPVNREGPAPRAPLHFDRIPADSALQAQVIGYPLAEDPTERNQFEFAIPQDATLELGYGIREESWTAGAEPTRFLATLVDARDTRHVLLDRTLDPEDPEQRRWFDLRADLSAHAGPATLLLESTRSEIRGRHVLPAWSDPVIYARADAQSHRAGEDQRPSVVVVSLDTLRSRSLGLYGYARDTAPFLASIAEQGVTFDDAITTSVTTAPSHMSLFTGRYPVGHGIRRGSEHKRSGLMTLSQAFRAGGYATAAFTENGYLLRPRGFGDGFAQYTENRGDDTRGLGDARVTFSQARAWIEASRQRPFFLFVHTYQVHTPYRPEGEYARLFEGDALPGPDTAAIRAERDNYDREIRVADDELRALFEAIEGSGPPGSVIVVVLSDHGEEFQEHGALQHGGSLFEETLRIPLVFWSPGRIPAGRRFETAVSLIDVAPTLLELAGLDALPQPLDGLSLAAALSSDTAADAALAERDLFAEAHSPRRWVDIWKFETWNPPLVAVRNASTKYVVHRPEQGEAQPTVRYDLADDPLEKSPQPVEGAVLERIDALVDGYLDSGAPGATDGRDGTSERLSPDVRERLEALGYAE